MPQEFTTSDGARISYEDRGRGRPLVLLSGWSCSTAFFRKNIEPLAKECRVIPVDFRAHGESQKIEYGHRVSRYARDLDELIDFLGLDRVVLLGWSMGAAVIWSAVELFGSARLAGQVCVDQAPRQYYSEDWRWGQPGCYDAESLAVLTTRLQYDPAGVARGVVLGCLGDTYVPQDEEVEFLASEICKCPPQVRADIMTDHTHLDWRDLLPRMTVPTLVCVGRQSKVFPNEGTKYVGEHIPGARTVFFEKSGHMPFYEEPEAFNRAVLGFIGSL